MRTFFTLVLAFLAFLIIITSLMVGVDLTPNTTSADPVTAPTAVDLVTKSQVIHIQESPISTSPGSAVVPVTGGCVNPYTVRSGDSLSQIAVNCNTTLAAIRQANLQITNANQIYPGQQIAIPNDDGVQIPVTGWVVPTPTASVPGPCTCDPASIPVTGSVPMLIPGSSLQVQAFNFPPNTPVNVALGPIDTGYTIVSHGLTDANGHLTTFLIVPVVSNSQTLWAVVVSTSTQPTVQAMSRVFNIDP